MFFRYLGFYFGFGFFARVDCLPIFSSLNLSDSRLGFEFSQKTAHLNRANFDDKSF